MSDFRLPERGEPIVFITPPTTYVDPRIFLYGHQVYSSDLHTRRLLTWLEDRGVPVTRVDCLGDRESRLIPAGVRTAGPGSRAPRDLPCYYYGLEERVLRDRLEANGRPSQVWITTLFAYDREILADTIRTVRSTLPGVPVIVGGTYASLCPDDCGRLGADTVHQGLLLASEEKLSVREDHVAFVAAGRGCPNRCAYCAFHLIEGARPVGYDRSRILAEVDTLVDEGSSLLALYAPSLFRGAMAGPTEDLVAGLAERDLTTLVWAGLEPLSLTPKRADLLWRAGVIDVSVPLQTLDRAIARGWGRRESVEEMLAAALMLRDAGYGPHELSSDIIIGHPDVPLDETIRTACFLWSRGITPVLFPYTCVPGTADARARGLRMDEISADTLHPYLWPFAHSADAADDYIQFATLSRVLPPLVGVAAETLDPDSVVPGLIERYLNEFNFSVPQWRPEVALPPVRQGYRQHFSHAWEYVLALVENGGVEQAARHAGDLERVTVCEPRYLEIPRAFLVAGLREAAVRVLPGASRCFSKSHRTVLADALSARSTPTDAAHRDPSTVVAEGLRSLGRHREAAIWDETPFSFC